MMTLYWHFFIFTIAYQVDTNSSSLQKNKLGLKDLNLPNWYVAELELGGYTIVT